MCPLKAFQYSHTDWVDFDQDTGLFVSSSSCHNFRLFLSTFLQSLLISSALRSLSFVFRHFLCDADQHHMSHDRTRARKKVTLLYVVFSIINRLRNACQTIVPLIETCCFLKRSFFVLLLRLICAKLCEFYVVEMKCILLKKDPTINSNSNNNVAWNSLRSFNSHRNCLLEFLCITEMKPCAILFHFRMKLIRKKWRRRSKSKWFFYDAVWTEAYVQCVSKNVLVHFLWCWWKYS